MIKESHAWPSFAIELERIETLQYASRTSRSLIFHDRKIRFLTLYLRLRGFSIESFVLLVVLFRSGYPDHLKLSNRISVRCKKKKKKTYTNV